MTFSKQVAGAAAVFLFGSAFLLAYGATSSASAQTQTFEAPALVAPAVATAVEPVVDADDALSSSDSDAELARPMSLAALVDDWTQAEPLDAQARCLATAVFFEARSESLAGQLAVANVVIARARSGRFPTSLCGVVLQRGQFGFVRGGRLPDVPESRPAWRVAQAIADIALDQAWENPVEGALYFHASYRGNSLGRERVARIGGHTFYR
jgi:N-acetylmuramoyl-L-alanine amidase